MYKKIRALESFIIKKKEFILARYVIIWLMVKGLWFLGI
jgi:hypothetical protein